MSSGAGALPRPGARTPALAGGHIPPPQNPEAEELLLASLIDAPGNVAEAMAVVSLDDFYREGHRRIFNAISELFAIGEPIEPIEPVAMYPSETGRQVVP